MIVMMFYKVSVHTLPGVWLRLKYAYAGSVICQRDGNCLTQGLQECCNVADTR